MPEFNREWHLSKAMRTVCAFFAVLIIIAVPAQVVLAATHETETPVKVDVEAKLASINVYMKRQVEILPTLNALVNEYTVVTPTVEITVTSEFSRTDKNWR